MGRRTTTTVLSIAGLLAAGAAPTVRHAVRQVAILADNPLPAPTDQVEGGRPGRP